MEHEDRILYSEEQERETNLVDVFEIVRIYKWWFVASLVVCIILAFLYLKSTPDIYQNGNRYGKG